jgi:outer membrane protein OmpA-like peptidoglycan-associated protein/tetratricopeptide (TPR) repeat protein
MQRIIIAALLVLAGSTAAWAQSAKEILKQGESFYLAKQYTKALDVYQQGLKKHPKDARLNFRTGLTYLSLPNKSESLRYLQAAFTINPSVDENIYYYLGLSYQSNKQFQKALEFFGEHKKRHANAKDDVDKRISQVIFADSAMRKPSGAVVENVGKAINSSFHEYSPLVSSDGNTMIFTSNRPNEGIASAKLYEDIYISKRVNNQWSKPMKISPNINIRFNDAAASLSRDGKTLVIYYEYGGGDIYISQLKGNEWSKPIPLNQNINSPASWETSAFIAADGKKLYFTSNRPGGVGSLDIYVSEMEMTGDWGKAKNLGPAINTAGREDSPAVDADGKTLFFSSDGHRGMGGTDIFRSEFKDGKWQKPVNMGYPINSIEDDSFFGLTGDRRQAFFSSMREDGNSEIYTLTFIEPYMVVAEPQLVAMDEPVKNTGSRSVRQPSSDGPQPVDKKSTASRSTTSAKRPVNYGRPGPLPMGPTLSRKILFFAPSKDYLNKEGLRKLDDVIAYLKANKDVKGLIEGHTDNQGNVVLNNALSIRRANSVASYLTERGVDPSRISVRGYGARRPLVSNDDEIEGRELNRRIELSLIKVAGRGTVAE